MKTRNMKIILMIISLTMVITLFTGCSQPVEEATDDGKDGEIEPMTMIAGSASSGGSNYLLMSGWAEIINKNTEHHITVEATGGPASNIELIAKGDAQIGVVAMSVADPAYNGIGWAKDKDYSMLRSMFGVHDALMDGITIEGKGIESIHDLNGKTLSVGPAGGTPALAVPDILDYFEIKPKYVNLGQGDSINALKDGQIDAAIFFGGVPRPAYQELAASHPAVRLGLSDEEVKKIVEDLPQYSIGVIEAGVYDYLDEDCLTLKDRYAYAVDKSIPEGVVYELVKATIDNLEEFKKVHKSLDILEVGDILLEGVTIPLHPGAIKALEEAEVEIPDCLIPPEMK